MKEYRKALCQFCKQEKFIAAQGLCRACYQRQKRTGTLEYQPKREISSCLVDGCERRVISHGYCELHWDRVKATGDPLKTKRPDDWGQKEKHPLWHSWQWAKTGSGVGVVPEWEDFWTFVRDVGERPTGKHKIKRLDESALFGPENCGWLEPMVSNTPGAAYAREHRKKNPDYWRDVELRKNYGIGLDDYQRMHDAQRGVCEICGEPETVVDKRNGRVRMLAVDHCHKKGNVRKLLCLGCNQMIGNAKENPNTLRAGAAYLEQPHSIVRDGVPSGEVAKMVDGLLEHRASDPRLFRKELP